MRVAFVGGFRWSSGTGRVPNRSVVVDSGVVTGIDVDPGDAQVIDVADGLLVPGFIDAHVHPLTGGLRMLTCDLSDATSRDEAEVRIAAAAASLEDGAWLTGGGWSYDWYPDGNPPARLLDRLAPHHPAALEVRDGHSIWANSRALSLAGVDSETPDPPDGRIERQADGEPQGTLHEGAMRLVESVIPEPDFGTVAAALRTGIAHLYAKGVTGWQDAWITDLEHRAYLEVGPRGAVVGAQWWDRERGVEQIPEIVERRRQIAGGYRPTSVKLMLDGVCENFTASLSAPYRGAHGKGDHHSGVDFIPPVVVAEAVTEFDRLGIQCHFHAIGDRAVRSALDAVEAARTANGWHGPYHHLAHLQVVDPADVPRFAELRVAANVQPLWACNDRAMVEMTVPFLDDERAGWQYPLASFRRAGALIAMGSDWPVSTADVMDQISVAMRRRPPGDDRTEPFRLDERLSLDESLRSFTLGSAMMNGTAGRTGRIRVGNVADLVLLGSDPFLTSDPAGIGVEVTMASGQVVFDGRDGS